MGTYSDLLVEIPDFLEARDDKFLARLPRIIELAQLRIVGELPITGLHAEQSGNFTVGSPFVTRPSGAVAVRYFNYVDPDRGLVRLHPHPSEWVLEFYPNQATLGRPRYYANFDRTRWIVAPTPDGGYAYTQGYRKAPGLLSEANQENELSERYYECLLNAALAQGAKFLLDDRRAGMREVYEAEYQRCKETIISNELARVRDAGHTQPPEGGN